MSFPPDSDLERPHLRLEAQQDRLSELTRTCTELTQANQVLADRVQRLEEKLGRMFAGLRVLLRRADDSMQVLDAMLGEAGR